MESDNNLNTDVINDNSDVEAATGWKSLMEDETMAEFVAALQKQEARERIEQNLGHVGTSALDIRDKITSRQAVSSEFGDYGVGGGDYEELFRQDEEDYLDEHEADLRDRHEKLSFDEVIGKYKGLFTFLFEDTVPNPNIEQKYQAITGQKNKLQFILDLPLVDKVKLFCSDNFGYANYDNFMHRLQFQQDFINGTAMVWTSRWDDEQRKYVDVQEPLDPGLAKPVNISLGLERASLRSAMIGTPEYGAYKMALDFARSWDHSITPDFPEIKGYQSGIYKKGNESSIGDWQLIIDEYQKIAEETAKRRPDLQGADLEYRAVRNAAWIFATSMEYNDKDRKPGSPYVSSFHESVAWVQLGQQVRAQLRGMRRKIDGVDLHNIGRFLGKSGCSEKYRSLKSERSRLSNRIEYINRLTDDGKQEFLAKENAFEIKKQEEWREKEIARINHKYGKLIDKTRSEERKAVYVSRQEEEIQRVVTDTSGRIEYFESRTLDGLFSDIDERRELLSRRIEKRKSLAEKAIKLHFATLPDQPDDEVPSIDCGIDWINSAPFSLIKKAHKLISQNLPQAELAIEIMKLQGIADEEIKSTVVKQAVRLQSCIGGVGGDDGEYMKRLDILLKKVIGENYKETDALDSVKSDFLSGLYVYANLDVSQIFSDSFMRSKELVEAAKEHFFLAADSEGQNKYCSPGYEDKVLFNAGSFGPGSGVLTIILEKYILPNEPDFFSKKENISGMKKLITQSAFLTRNKKAMREVSGIVENYANNQSLSDFCKYFINLSKDIKKKDTSMVEDVSRKEGVKYPYLITPKISTFLRELGEHQNIELPDIEDIEFFLRFMIDGREKELDNEQVAIMRQQDRLSAIYREEITLEDIGTTLARNYARCFAHGFSFDEMMKHKNSVLFERGMQPALEAGFLLEEIIQYPFLVSNLLIKERTNQ